MKLKSLRIYVRECDDLPLAMVALAGLLSTNENVMPTSELTYTVKIIETAGSWMFNIVRDSLSLSCDDLLPDIKDCLHFMWVFPKDDQIATDTLTQMIIGKELVTACEEVTIMT